eukprot:TRINITY_DN805_c0_g3_i2.p1 TRINITY_DN805_c0_g3~~TRINITY_DN805_c0_g3_i2.p1  ORF type:complete len:461 (-),score=101.99 TRINITY_DN805_c0_g3_i2:182-1564(-)
MKSALLITLVLGLSVASLANPKRRPLMTSSNIGNPKNHFSKVKDFEFKEYVKVDGFTTQQDTYAGYIKVRQSSESRLFYMYHSPRNADVNASAPLVVWLNGGPGCSSMEGDLGEFGPLYIKSFNKDTQEAEYGIRNFQWSNTNHLLFIDSPIGVGFSLQDGSDFVNTAEQAGRDLHTFLIRFFQLYPNLKDGPLYLFGESYAGHYIPAFAYEVYNNQDTTGIQLTGIGIGDGWVDPRNQIGFYDYYSYAAGLVSTIGRDYLTQLQNKAILDILNGNMEQASSKFDALTDYIVRVNPGINVYNYRQYNADVDGFIPDWANSPKVKQMLNIPPTHTFYSCVDEVYSNFTKDISSSYSWKVEALLGKVKVLIYSGQDDIIVNTAGTNNWLSQAEFPADMAANWQNVKKQRWTIEGAPVGTVSINKNFYYAVVNKAGHMVPTDNPRPALDMLNRYINGDQDWSQ